MMDATAKSALRFAAALTTYATFAALGHSLASAKEVSFRKIHLDAAFRSEGVAVADFNQDGLQDIAAGNIWYQAPTWQAHPMRSAPIAFDPLDYSDSFINFADDINHDGYPDLIVAGFPGAATRWYENPKSTSGVWRSRVIASVTNNESPAYEDLDGDGQKELVFGYSSDNNPDSLQRRLVIAKPQTDPTRPWRVIPISSAQGEGSGRYEHGLGIGDYNLDGREDVITTDGWYEQPANSIERVWTFHGVDFGPDSGQMQVYDFDGDGDQDVLSSSAHNYGIWWTEQTAQGAVRRLIYNKFSQSHSLTMADINSDGLPDFVTGKRKFAHIPPGDPGTFEPSVLYWFEMKLENGKPSWIPHEIDAVSGVGTQFETRDVNGDGLLDIVTSNKNGVFLFQQTPEGNAAGWIALFLPFLMHRARRPRIA